ncbi:hypothetical protein D9M68_214340 [compost metagenome]
MCRIHAVMNQLSNSRSWLFSHIKRSTKTAIRIDIRRINSIQNTLRCSGVSSSVPYRLKKGDRFIFCTPILTHQPVLE